MLGHRKLEVADYLDILKRRKWYILIPLVLVPILAGVATIFIKPLYLSQTLVLIDQQKVPDEYVKPVISADLDSRLASMKEQILSRSRIQPIIERYNLYAGQKISLDDKIEETRRNITIKASQSFTRTGSLPGFTISFAANDAHTAQLVCGEITTMFVNQNLKSREDLTEGTTDFLKSQLEDAKRTLDEQDAKLANFQRQYVGKLPGEEAPNVNMLTSLNTQLQAATQDLSRMEQQKLYTESMLAQVGGGTSSSSPALTVINADKETKQADLLKLQTSEADLLSHYTPDYPDVIAIRRRIADLQKQIAAMPAMVPADSPGTSVAAASHPENSAVVQLRSQLRAAEVGIDNKRKEQAMLEKQVSMYQERIASSPLVEQQYKQLTRDYDTAKQFYDDLLTKMNHSKLATALETQMQGEQFRIMDQPNLPDAPISPKRSLFIAGGVFGGLLLGLGLTAFLEYRNTVMRNERDVWAFTRLPTLAVINYGDSQSNVTGPKESARHDKSGKRVWFWTKKTAKEAAVS